MEAPIKPRRVRTAVRVAGVMTAFPPKNLTVDIGEFALTWAMASNYIAGGNMPAYIDGTEEKAGGAEAC